MNNLRKVSVRELQHNLASYLELAKVTPISVTKHGKDEVIMINPKKFKITKAVSDKKSKKDIRSYGFFGMYKNRKDWRGKSTVEIAKALRKRAWYGE